MTVLEFPPNESRNKYVNLESRYGILGRLEPVLDLLFLFFAGDTPPLFACTCLTTKGKNKNCVRIKQRTVSYYKLPPTNQTHYIQPFKRTWYLDNADNTLPNADNDKLMLTASVAR